MLRSFIFIVTATLVLPSMAEASDRFIVARAGKLYAKPSTRSASVSTTKPRSFKVIGKRGKWYEVQTIANRTWTCLKGGSGIAATRRLFVRTADVLPVLKNDVTVRNRDGSSIRLSKGFVVRSSTPRAMKLAARRGRFELVHTPTRPKRPPTTKNVFQEKATKLAMGRRRHSLPASTFLYVVRRTRTRVLVEHRSRCAAVRGWLPAGKLGPEEEPDGVEGGVTGTTGLGGVGGGVVGGVIGGVGAPPPPPPPSKPRIVPHIALRSQRIGRTAPIVPPVSVKRALTKRGKTRLVTVVKMCLNTRGTIASLKLIKSSGYPRYDGYTLLQMRKWRYRPYRVNGRKVPVCTAVTFVYHQRK